MAQSVNTTKIAGDINVSASHGIVKVKKIKSIIAKMVLSHLTTLIRPAQQGWAGLR